MEKPKEAKEHSHEKKQLTTKNKNNQIKPSLISTIYISLFTAIIAVCSQITIPTPFIPFTMQTFAVLVAGGILGYKRGTVSVLIYLLLGAIGVPVFSGFKSGLGALTGPTGGYLLGFVITVMAVGIVRDKVSKKTWIMIISMAVGILLCYAFGTAWFMIVYTQKNASISLWKALCICVFPYLLFDAGKIILATIVVKRLEKIIRF